MTTKQELINEIKPILERGKPINDIVFVSRKMTKLDVAMMLEFLRPTKKGGWEDKQLLNAFDTDMWGGDYFQQLLFGCIAALEVYTEDEIIKVFDVQQKYS